MNNKNKKYLFKNHNENQKEYQENFHHNLYKNALSLPIAVVISLICFSNAIGSIIKTHSFLIFLAQLDLFLIFILGHIFYQKSKFEKFIFLMKSFPYLLLLGWLMEIWVLYQHNDLHALPSNISINTMILVFAVVSFHPSIMKSMFNFLFSTVLLFLVSSLMFPKFKVATLGLFLEPIALSAFLHLMVSTVLKFSFKNSVQNDKLQKVFSKAKKQRSFLKDLLEASVELQKHEKVDELIISMTQKIANVFPKAEIGMLLIGKRQEVLISNFINYSDHDKAETLTLKENSEAKTLVNLTSEVEGQVYTLKTFIKDQDFDQDDQYILSTFLDQMSEVIRVKIMSALLERAAHLDSLTESYNRTYLNKVLEDFNDRIKNQTMSSSYAVVYCDVNGLKRINDLYGHGAGDNYIKEIAKNIKACIRDTDLLFRCGGDEFVILCPRLSVDSAIIIQERIEKTINSNFMIFNKDNKGFKEKMGVSIGLSDSSESEDPIALADSRMLSNKEAYYKSNVRYR